MQPSFTDSLTSILQKGSIFLLSFVDDAIVMTLGKLGVSLPGLHCLSTILITVSVCFWIYRIVKLLHHRHCQQLASMAA